MEKKRGIRHLLCEKLPAAAMVLSVFIVIALMGIFESVGRFITNGNTALEHFFQAAVAVLILFIIRVWFAPAYKGGLKFSVSQKEIIGILIPFIVYAVVNIVFMIITGDFIFKPTVAKLAQGLNAGVGEEAMFRAASIPIGLHFIKSEKRVTWTWVITSVVFGVMHLANIQAGGVLPVIIVQAIATTFMGIYFAMLFMCTGSIVLPIVVHSVWDYICFVTDGTLDNGVMTQATITFPLIIALLFNVAIGIAGLMLIYKNLDKIKGIWNEKWSG